MWLKRLNVACHDYVLITTSPVSTWLVPWLCHLTGTFLSLEVITSDKSIISLHTLHTYHEILLFACITDLFFSISLRGGLKHDSVPSHRHHHQSLFPPLGHRAAKYIRKVRVNYFMPDTIIGDYGSCLYVSICVSNAPQHRLLSFRPISGRSDTLVIFLTQLFVRLWHVSGTSFVRRAEPRFLTVTVSFTEFLNIRLTHKSAFTMRRISKFENNIFYFYD